MAVGAALPTNGFNWEEFWKKFAIYVGIIVGLITIFGIAFGLAEKLGIIEGQVQVLMQDRQSQNIMIQPTILPVPTK